mgnify:CR=1 FL=1
MPTMSDPYGNVCTMRNQTNLTIQFLDGTLHTFTDVHPDNHYADENGFLVVEFHDACLPIVYIPIQHIRFFDTMIVRSF